MVTLHRRLHPLPPSTLKPSTATLSAHQWWQEDPPTQRDGTHPPEYTQTLITAGLDALKAGTYPSLIIASDKHWRIGGEHHTGQLLRPGGFDHRGWRSISWLLFLSFIILPFIFLVFLSFSAGRFIEVWRRHRLLRALHDNINEWFQLLSIEGRGWRG